MNQRERIAAFLSGYIMNRDGSAIPPSPPAITEAIAFLIDSGAFTPESMKLEALRTQSVIIPDRFFMKED